MTIGDDAAAPACVARLVADGDAAHALLDGFDTLLGDDVVCSAFMQPDGQWSVSLTFRNPPDEEEIRALARGAAGDAAAQALTFDVIPMTDWVRASLEGLAPVAAGRFVVHGAHDRARVAANRIGIEIEAALAFGTGHHGTTRGCLLALDGLLKRTSGPLRVLDVGTGTGVLAIAAARAPGVPRGGTRVLASDIDARAVRVARDNARLNRVAARVEVVRASGLEAGIFRARSPYDLIFANILLQPLQRLARRASLLAAPGACVILSGLLHAHVNAALAAYSLVGFRLKRTIRLGEWSTLVMVRGRRAPKHGIGQAP